ncbi:amidase [Ramlibacter tataouinensis]|uniref:Glutamyl-tRNA(Gln) amidotransferase subunit A-like protein n=1 Tax=Ramlibacter tataouinensis (strain ATCC BAA-407 / DSM 14655 / LMG 21543 / TTB310) TaxID=365046 RepID=F5Y4C8_RAMTT|nr:amidase [Ramlibacter tataouinensis]AEG93775.1 glutamyl-tRNA(Gln) amidotransferase subunit A-like protein [Ramlibacter tataouinensis TTB310]
MNREQTFAHLERTLDDIARRDAGIGAFVALHDRTGLQVELDRALAGGGALGGLPVAVKDIFDTAHLPTAYGSALFNGHRPRFDAAMVQAIRRAGGVVVGKSSSTEFAFLHPAATRNPRSAGHTPGGSSAGSAAAVAAGLVPLAVGTQTGGSVIRPASYCGVAGFKPSFAVLPTAGLKPFSWSLDTVGLFAPTVAELARGAQAIAGQPWADQAGLGTGASAASNGGALRFGFVDRFPWGETTPSAAQALNQGRSALQAAGATMHDVALPGWMAEVFHAHDAVQGWEAARALADEYEFHADALSPVLRDYLASARAVSDAAYHQAQQSTGVGRRTALTLFDSVDVLVTPSAPDEPPPLSAASTGSSSFNRAWTLLGLPCLNVAGGTGVKGLPMGLQVIAPPRRDALCLRAGDVLERALAASR